MKMIKKIVAYFKIKGEPQQMELSSAEIREKGVFLHPLEDAKHTFFVHPESVDIILNLDGELNEEDFMAIDRENAVNESTNIEASHEPPEQSSEIRPVSLAKFMPRKKRFTIMVYPDEYDMLIDNIVNKGYKKAEYFLACVKASKKQSWANEYKSFSETHKARMQSNRRDARTAQEQDYINHQQTIK